ncbi:RNA-directed DNA polymerase, eukaryota, reverse transcriptase zinc-binding domain protein [Tanacetum coccineum]|uniref:RNA-directed DNA polymerase, eukaryota, reverse transcriptase zinc-binding domain protein n=1 Tax=Tanacetum coccineum TaxID=301880 RepID=A0ABQ4ZCQ2_9ASTR
MILHHHSIYDRATIIAMEPRAIFIYATAQSMLYKVEVISSKNIVYCTFIYAANKGKDRRDLWKELNLNKRLIGDSAWVIMGDVNVSLNLEDHSEGISNFSRDMIEFQECVNEIEIEDINSTGMHFTWTKSLLNPNATVLKKIDRIMGNSFLFDTFNNASAIFLPYGISDHSPAILIIPQAMVKKRKSFRLANYITDKVEFQEVVKDEWNTEVHGYAMYRLVSKLKCLKQHLNNLNWKNGNLFDKVVDLKTKIFNVQKKIDLDPFNKELRKENAELLKDYKEASMDEEKLLRQKAKVSWLREGDKNSAYFHKVLKGRVNKNRIMTICDEDGNRYDNSEVAEQFVKHFEGFLGTSPPVTKITDDDSYLFERKINENEANLMVREVSDEEIKNALFDIDDDKAPGPDGYTSKFYKKAWNIIKEDFCAAIKEFFANGKLLGEVNATIIILVPKSLTPQKVSDFRPIACCNVTYKCISKILTNRIKIALNQVVEENQSAFVPGRAITDNILLTQELLKGYNCINGPKRCSFKIDIQKAYDTVNWLFIEDILKYFGFPMKMIGWIMTCITTPKFTICVNGERFGYFKGGRGLRQGDPISPYIFTMVMEMLNLLVKDEIRKERDFKFHFGCKQLRITHLCFADDLIMFCHGNKISVQTLKRSLDRFSEISGLHPNLGKCTMFCGSLEEDTKKEIGSIFQFKEGKLPVRYLGVPLVTKKIGANDCKQLVDKIKQRLNDWKNKSLSYAGRAQLIASVLGSMQVYWGSVFLLPKGVINDIERLFKKFLWNIGDSGKGRAKVAWIDVCKPKDQGGLGFKSLELWNKTLLVKHLWNVAAKKESLWVKWINVVKLKQRSVWDIDIDSKDSWGWKCILISDLINENGWRWPQDWLVKHPWLGMIHVRVLSNTPDKLVFVDNDGNDRSFSTNNVWKDVRGTSEKVNWCKLVWHTNCIPKHSFILWLAAKKKLCTQDRLAKWYPNRTFECSLCQKGLDSHDHLFFNCDYTQKFWSLVCDIAKIKFSKASWDDNLNEMSKGCEKQNVWVVIRKLCFGAAIYYIWHERNSRLFNNCKKEAADLFASMMEEIKARLVSITVKESNNNSIESYSILDSSKCNEDAGYGLDIMFPAKAVGQLGDALAVGLSCWTTAGEIENRSFTLSLVMPPIRALMFIDVIRIHKRRKKLWWVQTDGGYGLSKRSDGGVVAATMVGSGSDRCNSIPFDALNLVENDDDLGTNGENSKLLRRGINDLEGQMLNEKLVLVDDDDGKPLKKVDSLVILNSDSEVEEVFNETTGFMALTSSKVDNNSKSGSGMESKSMYEQIREVLKTRMRWYRCTRDVQRMS